MCLITVPASPWMLVTVETTANQSSEPVEVGSAEDEEAGRIQWVESSGVAVETVCCVPVCAAIVLLLILTRLRPVLLKVLSVSGVSVAMETKPPASSKPFPNKPEHKKEIK